MLIIVPPIIERHLMTDKIKPNISATLLEEEYIPQVNGQQKTGKYLQDSHDFIDNIDSIFRYMPGAICWKDRDSVFLGCNDLVARLAGLSSTADIVGKTDQDMIWGKGGYAEALRINDQQVLGGIAKLSIGRFTFADGSRRTMLVKKFPLIKPCGSIIGTACTLNEIPIANLQNILSAIENHGFKITNNRTLKEINQHYIDEAYQQMTLSAKERQVLYYLVRGGSAKIIAYKMCLSPRTIEDYINNLKYKFNCRTKADVIRNVFESGIIQEIM